MSKLEDIQMEKIMSKIYITLRIGVKNMKLDSKLIQLLISTTMRRT